MNLDQPASDQWFKQQIIKEALHSLIGDTDDTVLAEILSTVAVEWHNVQGNQVLFEQDTAGDSLYILASGRMGAYVSKGDSLELVGEITKGETIGEMALFTGEKRAATVIAHRDCLLAQITAETFFSLTARYPQVSIFITRQIAARLRRQNEGHQRRSNASNIVLMPISGELNALQFAQQLAEQIKLYKSVTILHPDLSNEIAQLMANESKEGYSQALTRWLNEQENHYDTVLYLADAADTPWTRRCIRQADGVLMVANIQQSPKQSEVESLLQGQLRNLSKRIQLVLVRESEQIPPHRAHKWLLHRQVSQCLHLEMRSTKDFQRIARYLTGNAIGLVLAGGGARGIAHLGIFQALQEAEIPIDAVGGTSFGALVAAAIAQGMNSQQATETGLLLLSSNPSDDYNIIPLVSISKGKKVKKVTEYLGKDLQIEDTYIPFFCVSSNMSRSTEKVHREGSLAKALRASTALPGIFPPVIEKGELLVDGCVFNNLPVDIMAEQMGVGKIIAVDLYVDRPGTPIDFELIPNPFVLIADKFGKRKYKKIPSLMNSLMTANILCSNFKSIQLRKQVDVLFNPHLKGIGLLDWKKFKKIVSLGHEYATDTLKNERHRLE